MSEDMTPTQLKLALASCILVGSLCVICLVMFTLMAECP